MPAKARAKIIASMGPSIEKETVLNKIANLVDGFRINLAHMNEDIIKKYIGSIEKIDSSKAIILDTKGAQVRTKNEKIFELKKGKIITIGFENNDLDIDYEVKNIQPNQKIYFDNYKLSGKIVENNGKNIFVLPDQDGEIKPNKNVIFQNHEIEKDFLSFKDKKYISMGVRLGANIISISVKDQTQLDKLKEFLNELNQQDIKILIKIQHFESVKNFGMLTDSTLCDGIVLDVSILKHIITDNYEKTVCELVKEANLKGKVVLLSDDMEFDESTQNKNLFLDGYQKALDFGVDGFIMTHQTSSDPNPLLQVQTLYNDVYNYTTTPLKVSLKDLHSINIISDYISYTSLESIKFLAPKIMICPTEKGNMAARLASLKPTIPILAITKSHGILKYLNLLWGVKGFKISQEFELENVRRISKEVIRTIFKGDITLDENVIIIHSNLSTSGSANGMSIYKFKDL